jgi:hypothetical protein
MHNNFQERIIAILRTHTLIGAPQILPPSKFEGAPKAPAIPSSGPFHVGEPVVFRPPSRKAGSGSECAFHEKAPPAGAGLTAQAWAVRETAPSPFRESYR